MRAMIFETPDGPDALMVSERPVPEPGPGEVLVKIGAASINYRDLLIAKGGYRSRQKQADLVPLSDGAGTVEAVGPGVHAFKAGDRVTACFFLDWPAGTATEHAMESDSGRAVDGMLQEYRTIPVSGLVRTPDHLSDAEALALVYQLLGAINYLGMSEPTLTQMFGEATFEELCAAYPRQLRALIRSRFACAG